MGKSTNTKATTGDNCQAATEYRFFSCQYASCLNAQLPLTKVAVLGLDKLVVLDPLGADSGLLVVSIVCDMHL